MKRTKVRLAGKQNPPLLYGIRDTSKQSVHKPLGGGEYATLGALAASSVTNRATRVSVWLILSVHNAGATHVRSEASKPRRRPTSARVRPSTARARTISSNAAMAPTRTRILALAPVLLVVVLRLEGCRAQQQQQQQQQQPPSTAELVSLAGPKPPLPLDTPPKPLPNHSRGGVLSP